MCGIVGQMFWSGTVDPARLDRMNARLTPRGPDDAGLWHRGPVGLAMRRLKVIDLHGGQQPMSNEGCSRAASPLRLVFNGEIYNHPSLRDTLRARGHRFVSSSDTEVILHAFEEWGAEAWTHLRGMFALGLYEETTDTLHLVRDRLGIKPLYVVQGAEGVSFASEVKALVADPNVPKEVDPESLNAYFSLGYVPAPRSIYRDIQKLEPGETLKIHRPSRSVTRSVYWDFRPGPPPPKGLAPTLDALDRLLASTVQDHLISDVPLGLFLSGGLDSATVAYYARAAGRPLDSFTIYFGDGSFSERREAALTAAHLGLRHHEEEMLPSADLLAPLGQVLDEPLADPSVLPTYYLCRSARKQVTVTLAGDGGDELFAGYPTYLADRWAGWFRRSPGWMQNLARALADRAPTSFERIPWDYRLKAFVRAAARPQPDAHFGWLEAFLPEEKERLFTPEFWSTARNFFPESSFRAAFARGADRSPLEQFLFLDQRTRMVDQYLVKVDRLSMAHSLEVRVPLLDHAVVEFAAGIPSAHKVRGRRLKYILRRLMEKRLPPEVLKGPKRGFAPPLAHWLAGPLRPWAEAMLSPDRLRRSKILRPEFPRFLLEEHLSRRRDNHRRLWTILSFLLWQDHHP